MGVVECKLCSEYGVSCQDVGILFFKRRAIFVRDVQTHEGQPISKCPAVIDNAKISEVATQIVFEAGEIPEMYTEDYKRD